MCCTRSTSATDDDDENDDDDDDVVGCSPTEFTCHNDRCVPRSRCNDRINDCWDNSDETSCGIVQYYNPLTHSFIH